MDPKSATAQVSDNCPAIFNALGANRSEIEYIGPDVGADDLNVPILAKYTYCETEAHLNRSAEMPGPLISLKREIGSHALRVYMLEIDNDSSNGLG